MLTIKNEGDKGFPISRYTSFLINDKDVGQYISSVDVKFRPDSIVTANVEICARLDVAGAVIENVHMPHPISGDVKRVKTVIFDDGSSWECKE